MTRIIIIVVALLAAAGFGPGQPLRLVLLVPPAIDWQQLAEALAASLKPLGIELALMPDGKAPRYRAAGVRFQANKPKIFR